VRSAAQTATLEFNQNPELISLQSLQRVGARPMHMSIDRARRQLSSVMSARRACSILYIINKHAAAVNCWKRPAHTAMQRNGGQKF
jgi:hypothetical protein